MSVSYPLRRKRRSIPSQSELMEIFEYNHETGIFLWKKSLSRRVKLGDVAGSPDKYGYIQIMIGGRNFKAHRLAWILFYGKEPAFGIDHKDRMKNNNAIYNLREATPSQNICNSRKTKGRNKYKGVFYDSGKYCSRITLNGETQFIGKFNTSKEAAIAYDEAAKKIHGEFALTNF